MHDVLEKAERLGALIEDAARINDVIRRAAVTRRLVIATVILTIVGGLAGFIQNHATGARNCRSIEAIKTVIREVETSALLTLGKPARTWRRPGRTRRMPGRGQRRRSRSPRRNGRFASRASSRASKA